MKRSYRQVKKDSFVSHLILLNERAIPCAFHHRGSEITGPDFELCFGGRGDKKSYLKEPKDAAPEGIIRQLSPSPLLQDHATINTPTDHVDDDCDQHNHAEDSRGT